MAGSIEAVEEVVVGPSLGLAVHGSLAVLAMLADRTISYWPWSGSHGTLTLEGPSGR